MIRITCEMWPNGDESRARKLWHIDISNRSDLAAISDYMVQVVIPGDAMYVSHIFKQKRANGWVRILRAALDQVIKDFPKIAEFKGPSR